MAGTKAHILDVAERLFAEQGVGATSLRGIMAAAGVNPAAVHYHFGGKGQLLEAVVVRRLEPVTAERMRRLDALEAGAAEPLLEDLIEAYVAPALKLAAEVEGALFMRLLGRVHNEADEATRELVLRLVRPVIQRFAAAFGRALPERDPLSLAWRTHFAVGAMAHTMACREYTTWIDAGAGEVDLDTVIGELVAFATAGLRAAAPVRQEGAS